MLENLRMWVGWGGITARKLFHSKMCVLLHWVSVASSIEIGVLGEMASKENPRTKVLSLHLGGSL